GTLHLPVKPTDRDRRIFDDSAVKHSKNSANRGVEQEFTSLEKFAVKFGTAPGEGDFALEKKNIDRLLREVTYHPESFFEGSSDRFQKLPGEARMLVEEKQRWISTPQTIDNARTRCHAIRRINGLLQHWAAPFRERLLRCRDVAAQRENAAKILTWREYAFCLYPEEVLRDFLDSVLPADAISDCL
ncbi:MAG: hypothetical protein ACWGMZ_13380, partial [Thermoguttaceae bacterium]